MQYKLILASAAILTLAACTPAKAPSADGDSSSSTMMNGGQMMDDDDMMGSSKGSMMDSSKGAMMDDDGMMAGPRVVDVTVTDWTFSPTTVTLKKGEKVALRIKGDKGIHSLLVADLGVNIRVEPGDTSTVTIPTDMTGTFAGRCGVPCGPGHRDMKFTIVVE